MIYAVHTLWHHKLSVIYALGLYCVMNYPTNIPYTCIAYHSWGKVSLFHIFTFIPQKNIHSYQLLQTFIVFMCKIPQKTFTVAKQSAKNMESFSSQIISNIWYKKVVGYYEMIWCHVFIVDLVYHCVFIW